jgi:peptidylprolyl isomerase
MKKLLVLLVAFASGAVLAACGDVSYTGESPFPSTPTPNAADELGSITWVDGDQPSLEFAVPFPLTSNSGYRLIKDGDGATVEAGDVVLLDYVFYAGDDGTRLGSTYEQGQPHGYQVAAEEPAGDPLWAAVIGQKGGANLIVGWLTAADSTEGASASSATPVLVALTISSVIKVPSKAHGSVVEPTDPKLPKVTLSGTGQPAIEIPAKAVEPTELVQQILIQGDGKPATATGSVVAHYTGWLWSGEQFDSSWDRGSPATFSLQEVIAGWTEGLAGVPANSQVLLIIPPELGYGASGSGAIPGDATLIFVVDILAVF